ncbi:MAG: T9SS type A sorting domain-containing protein [Candidatus Delongbacteria bacterium]|nr:T9SS type A sorting domain-containing protein [Candidatus Delongbacteria bacterium]MBN2834508.1 T9SS type A sorting domain-containing protein [Candidatus Delongbacteria bacterium]
MRTFLLLIIYLSLISAPPGWEYEVTDKNHTFILIKESNPNIGNVLLTTGDWIGAFYDDEGVLKCAGYVMYQAGVNNGMSVFGDNTMTPEKDGLEVGEEVKWKIYKTSTHTQYSAISGFIDPIVHPYLYYTGSGTFFPDAISGFDKLGTELTTNEKPVVEIPDQTTVQGIPFPTLILDNYVSDDTTPPSNIVWSTGNSQKFDITISNRIAMITPKNPNWVGSERITFYAKDEGGFYGADYVLFTINENTPPVITDIPDKSITYGSEFPEIDLGLYVSDDYTSDLDMEWEITGGVNLSVIINQYNIAQVIILDENWSGSETLTFKAIDQGGLFDTDDAVFTITANQAPYVHQLGNPSIISGAQFPSFDLDEYVTDDTTPDPQIIWSITGNTNIQYFIDSQRVISFTYTDGWTGSETLNFKATDSGNLSSSRNSIYTVTSTTNQPPVVSNIADQSISPGEEFLTISLDDYVSDDTTPDNQISWSITGNNNLNVDISTSRIVTITYPEGWTGNEMLNFKAIDLDGQFSSDNATFAVLAGANLPPVISNIPGQIIIAGDEFEVFDLDDYVSDDNTPDELISWQISGDNFLTVTIDPERRVTITPPSLTWTGSETLTFKASDQAGLYSYDSADFTVTIPGGNQEPSVTSFPSQTIGQGYSFANLYLDYYVTDDLTPDENIIWSISSGTNIIPTIDDNRILSFNIVNPNWIGTEIFTITATDEGGLSDYNTTTLSIVEGGTGNGPGWGVIETNIYHTILIYNDATPYINGVKIVNGDYIGVFYEVGDSLRCGGYIEWSDSKSGAVKAFGDLPATPWQEGFVTDEMFKWKVWKRNTNQTYNVTADYFEPNGTITHREFFADRGLSRLVSLANTDPNNRPPHVGSIPDQNVFLGTQFSPVFLDPFVCDDYTSDEDIIWQFESQRFDITISEGREAIITPKDYFWSGSELVRFTAIDEGGLTGYKDVLLIVDSNTSVHPGWNYNITGGNHTLLLYADSFIGIDDIPLTDNDFVGVFYNDNGEWKCGGYAQHNSGLNYAVSAWADDPDTDDIKEGFVGGEYIKWRIWRQIDNRVFDSTAKYWPVNGTTITAMGNFVIDGISKVSQLYCYDGNSPQWEFNVTENMHQVLMLSDAVVEINGVSLAEGDYIGAFYEDSGIYRCGGYIRWTQNIDRVIRVFGDLLETQDKEGFSNDEYLTWRIWKRSDQSIFETETIYQPAGGVITDTDHFATGGLSKIIEMYNLGSIDHDIIVKWILPSEGGYAELLETHNLQFIISAYDPDGNDLIYNWKLDNNAVSADSVFIYTPDYGDAGSHIINLDVTDGGAGNKFYQWDVNVIEFNLPPEIYSISDKFIAENEILIFDVKATDPEEDPVTYHIGDGIKPGMNINPQTGRFNWSVNNLQQGVHYLDLIARQGTYSKMFRKGKESGNTIPFLADTTTVKITVYDVSGNIVTTGLYPNWGDQVVMSENDTLSFTANCYNKLGHTLYYEWKLNNSIVLSSENHYDFITGYSSSGEYDIKLSVDDQEVGSTPLVYEWHLVVNEVNRAPEIVKTVPLPGNLKIYEYENLEFTIDAHDPDGDNLNYQWFLDGQKQSDENFSFNLKKPIGVYSILAKVSDGKSERIQEWVVNVEENLIEDNEIVKCYPNPFNPTTTILFTLKEDMVVEFELFNIKGEVVKKWKPKTYMRGYNNFVLHGESLTSGVYFVAMNYQSARNMHRIIVIK